MVVVHEFSTSALEGFLDLVASHNESSDDSSHVFSSGGGFGTSSLHRYDSEMIFFSDPNEEVGIVVVEE